MWSHRINGAAAASTAPLPQVGFSPARPKQPLVVLAVISAALFVLVLAQPAHSRTSAWEPCGTITVNGHLNTLKVKGISCSTARSYVTGGAPRGWQCAASALVCWRGLLRSDPETSSQAYEAFPASRYVAYVGGTATGAGHHFVVGDGLNLVFGDTTTAPTAYRVCWGLAIHAPTRCASRTTVSKAGTSRIFIAPQVVGNWVARWYVAGRLVASWTWYQGPGD